MTFGVHYRVELKEILSVPPEDIPNDDDWPDEMPSLLEKAIRARFPIENLLEVELIDYEG